TLKTTTLERPNRPSEVGASELSKPHLAGGKSQAVFARLLNVSTRTIQSWEQGQRKPSQAALRLIQIFRQDPAGLFGETGLNGLMVTAGTGTPCAAGRRTRRS